VLLEIGDSWLRHVLFCFENIEAMLDKLSALYGSMIDASRRVKFEQKPHHGQELRADMFPADGENDEEDWPPTAVTTRTIPPRARGRCLLGCW
jgi:hypothetical protein